MIIVTILFSFLIPYAFLLRTKIFELEKEKENFIKVHNTLKFKLLELSQLNKKFEIEATTDTLTGINNRRYFFKQSEKLITHSIKKHSSFFIIIIDIDFFKKINDTYGHDIGDVTIKHVAKILKNSLRENDILARFGGEEFIIGLPKSNLIMAKSIAERIRITIMNSKINVGKTSIKITISIGISQYMPFESNIEPAIKRADDALYKAKNCGRNCVIVKL
jgi:diguanylate cyclase (GGDEF)-like protein